MDMDIREQWIETFYTRCRGAGLSITPQRLAIYKALINSDNHPSPEMIYHEVQQDFPMISVATVYKTLNTFEQIGIITTVTHVHDTIRYDPMTKRHHHLICARCKTILDIENADLDSLPIPANVSEGNILLNYSVHFSVICSECRSNE